MGIKEILNKHIYKNKYLLKRPDPRPFIFPQGTYAIPTSKNSNQQHHTWNQNSYIAYQNYLYQNQFVAPNRQGFGPIEQIQQVPHTYVNDNLHSSGSDYNLSGDKSRRNR